MSEKHALGKQGRMLSIIVQVGVHGSSEKGGFERGRHKRVGIDKRGGGHFEVLDLGIRKKGWGDTH